MKETGKTIRICFYIKCYVEIYLLDFQNYCSHLTICSSDGIIELMENSFCLLYFHVQFVQI